MESAIILLRHMLDVGLGEAVLQARCRVGDPYSGGLPEMTAEVVG
jgi:hypothetical protein